MLQLLYAQLTPGDITDTDYKLLCAQGAHLFKNLCRVSNKLDIQKTTVAIVLLNYLPSYTVLYFTAG